jgi:hypothetical protein
MGPLAGGLGGGMPGLDGIFGGAEDEDETASKPSIGFGKPGTSGAPGAAGTPAVTDGSGAASTDGPGAGDGSGAPGTAGSPGQNPG